MIHISNEIRITANLLTFGYLKKNNNVFIINLGIKGQGSQEQAIILDQISSVTILITTEEHSYNPSLYISIYTYAKTLLGTVKMWTLAKILETSFPSLISLICP